MSLIDAHEVSIIAKDLGITPDQLQEAANKGPDAAGLLNKMLTALKVDSKRLCATWFCVSANIFSNLNKPAENPCEK